MSIVEINYEELIKYVKNKMDDKTSKNGYINNYLNIFPLIKKWLDKNGHNIGVNKVADVIYDLGELREEIEMSRTILQISYNSDAFKINGTELNPPYLNKNSLTSHVQTPRTLHDIVNIVSIAEQCSFILLITSFNPIINTA